MKSLLDKLFDPSFDLFDRQTKHFLDMRRLALSLLNMCGRLLLENTFLENYVKSTVSDKIDELERKFPIMAEHYKYMRWGELQTNSIEDLLFNIMRLRRNDDTRNRNKNVTKRSSSSCL